MNANQLKQLVLDSFAAEKASDAKTGLTLVHPDIKITEMNVGSDGRAFYSESGQALRDEIEGTFQITTRDYQFVHVMADVETQSVMVEFVESYLDEDTGQYFRTPIVAVCEIKDGLIFRTRHYTDNRLSHLYLDQTAIDEALS
jgi:ketosteroid isomerase-like protein